ncbi:GTPase Era [Candidatus Liberibacter asiaticus]|uniref:GTPase Era n=2 Tax=Liberibacter asiaticus TaxID=34021 RepID=C6XGB1_LIBAP|nr:GTPase Era [Candidatus Liberibacter asiaticus]ACT57414.1 GTP-binding protein Era [Candidatus Liberibacter asiaticus str. psy62]AGH17177.1 GTP-binding protein Era [Candidatus Liberibacter asiaticus str. gxpsy]ALK07482.1 GTPase Era [Candidatus Liberibacter asiaticus]ASK52972.1 GTPase Era [Candidatus Liberibacter asiaticus]AWL14298.1 GTPase Era [Candidatus Liberibacter asiaticus]
MEMGEITFFNEHKDFVQDNSRSGCVALVGATNAGKSTLVNRFVGAKVSIVTHKVQTTRSIVRGIVSEKESQIVFLDTPGIFNAKDSYHKLMIRLSWSTIKHADIVCLVVDSHRELKVNIHDLLKEIAKRSSRLILILNKIDCVKPERLLEQAEIANKLVFIEKTFMVSATKGHGCDDVLNYLCSTLPLAPWVYSADQISDLPMFHFTAEITREKLFLHLHKEIPYSSCVVTEKWEEKKDGSILIRQVIYVERPSQKKIMLGKNGQNIKTISLEAKKEIAEILEQPVHLILFVKVQKDWGHDPKCCPQREIF